MSPGFTLSNELPYWPWWLAGACVGWWIVPLVRIIPGKVLQFANAPLDEWVGPGGGLMQPVPRVRRIWVPVVNALLWGCAAHTSNSTAFWAPLPWAGLFTALLLLALIDWDTTMLPDWIVLPLGLAGLACSYAGLARQNVIVSALSAAFVLGLLGGLGWIFRRIRGVSGIGGGDLKLLAALAAWWGFVGVLYIVLLASLGTVVWNLAWRRFKGFGPQAEWPFGPSIAAAALAWGVRAAFSPS
jgi:leader peptidase (prepilin peptidase) / N-methyltransferase